MICALPDTMEKINALIDRLQELKNSNADLQTISYYAQLLQVEVLHARTLQKAQDQSQKIVTEHYSGDHALTGSPDRFRSSGNKRRSPP